MTMPSRRGAERPRIELKRTPRIVWLLAPLFALTWFATLHRCFREDILPQPLPPYSLGVQAGSTAQPLESPREGIPIQIQERSHLSLVLRPLTPVAGPLEIRAYLPDGNRWPMLFQRHPGGVFSLNERIDTHWTLGPGTHDLLFLIGRPTALPKDPYEIPKGHGGVGWQALSLRVQLEPGDKDHVDAGN